MKRPVLIIEDDYAFRWALAIALQRKGIDADVAENGQEAVDLLARHKYQVLILDLKLPRVGGEEIIDMLVREQRSPSIVLVSAYPDAAETVASRVPELVRRTYKKPVDINRVVDDLVTNLLAA